MHLNEKIIYTFNKFFSSFLKDLKESHEDIRAVIKQNYKIIDKMSPDYITYYKEHMGDFASELVKKEPSFSTFDSKEFCKELTIAMVLSKLDEEDKNVFWNYIYILSLLAHVHSLNPTDVLFDQVVKVIGIALQKSKDSVDEEVSDILDDDVRELLLKMFDHSKKLKSGSGVDTTTATESETQQGLPDIFSKLENSKICNLAKEISQEIDLSGMDIKEPADLMKVLDFSGSNNVLGNMIQKVSSKLNDKITSGDLKQEDLLGEAMMMMNMLNDGKNPLFSQLANNPLMSSLMKNMKKGNTAMRQDVFKKHDARERLRRKLELKKKNVE